MLAPEFIKEGRLCWLRSPLYIVNNKGKEKIFNNEEIKLLLSAMNIVPGKYDSKKLRYGKLGICVDADSDGAHIALLIMAALQYKVMIGRPQYTYGDSVCFAITIDGEKNIFEGTIEIVDAYGTFEQNEEPSYDIMVDVNGAHCLFKHIRESLILGDE